MRGNRKLMVAVFVLLTSFFAGARSTHPGALQARTWNAIKISYMNGYVQALRLDSEQIEKLKTDEALLRQAVMDAATQYMQIVEAMNR